MNINNISDSCVSRIGFFLVDRDLQALGCVSKRMNALTKKELVRRDNMYHTLLRPFTATRRYNIQSYKEANLFCFGDEHKNPECNPCDFINFLASRGRVFVVDEVFPSLMGPQGELKRAYMKEKNLNLSYEDNIIITGWNDQKKLFELFNEIDCEYKEKLEEYKNKFENTSNKETSLQYKFSCTLGDLCTIPYSDNISLSDKLEIKKLESEIVNKKSKAIDQVFQIMKESMITTLKALRGMKIALIAGNNHLETPLDKINDENYKLTHLYDELKYHKSVVLMNLKVRYEHTLSLVKMREEIEKIKNLQISENK